jgi:hypothetical protein
VEESGIDRFEFPLKSETFADSSIRPHFHKRPSSERNSSTGTFFIYRGIACIIQPGPKGFQTAIAWNGKSLRVRYGGRKIWNRWESSRKAAKAFVRDILKNGNTQK